MVQRRNDAGERGTNIVSGPRLALRRYRLRRSPYFRRRTLHAPRAPGAPLPIAALSAARSGIRHRRDGGDKQAGRGKRTARCSSRTATTWVGQHISRGINAPEGESPHYTGPTIVVDCTPLPLYSRGRGFREGIEVIVPSIRRTPPEALSPRAKLCNYINVVLGDLEAKARNRDAWAVLLDQNGNLAEGTGCNIFLVEDGALRTPREDFVLPGVSRQVAMGAGRGARHRMRRGRPLALRRVQRR